MDDQKNTMNGQSSGKSWFEMMQEDKAYCYSVLQSDEFPVEKIKLLVCNPQSSDNIVLDLIKHGEDLRNRLYENKVFPNGDDLRVFLSRNKSRFDAIGVCFKEIEADSDVPKINQRFLLDVEIALIMRDIYDSEDMVLKISHDCTDAERVENFVNAALAVVDAVAKYKNMAFPLDDMENRAYVCLQEVYIRNFFDILREDEEEEDEEYEDFEENEGSDVASEAVKSEEIKSEEPVFENKATDNANSTAKAVKKKKKIPFIFIVDIVCLVIFLVLTILAVIMQDSTVNIIMLITGILEVGVAVLLFYIARQRERFTCPQCGTKRVHHRVHLSTSNHITTTNGNRKTTYKHQYLDTYTCPECGCELEVKVNKDGGYYMEFADGTEGDHRIWPNEF